MELTDLEQHVYAYFLSEEALAVRVDGRFYRREEFVKVFEDKLFYSTRRWGPEIAARHSNIANVLVDKLIDAQGLLSTHDELSGTYHQMNDATYRQVIKDFIQSNAICQRAVKAGPQFWNEVFGQPSGP
jgi:hypothetical protein